MKGKKEEEEEEGQTIYSNPAGSGWEGAWCSCGGVLGAAGKSSVGPSRKKRPGGRKVQPGFFFPRDLRQERTRNQMEGSRMQCNCVFAKGKKRGMQRERRGTVDESIEQSRYVGSMGRGQEDKTEMETAWRWNRQTIWR